MRFPRFSRDRASGRGHDAGDGRNYRAGVSGLVLAAAVVFLVVMNLHRLSLWGMTAAVVWLLTLFILTVNSLSRIRNPVLTSAGFVGFMIGGAVLVAWSFGSPQELIGGRTPDEWSVRMRAVEFAFLLVFTLGWSVRRWRRNRRSACADLSAARTPSFAKTKPGYRPSEVDGLLARLNGLPDTAEGRTGGRSLIEGARFQQSRGYGYNTHQVDQHLKRILQHYSAHADKPSSNSSITV